MKSFSTVLLESIFVGVVLILFTYIASFLLRLFNYPKKSLPEICSEWNDFYVMEVSLFVAGFLFHMFFEYTNLNKWYVDNYYK